MSKPHSSDRKDERDERREMIRTLLGQQTAGQHDPVEAVIHQTLQSLVSHMGLRVQQICTIFMEQPMVDSSRKFILVDCHPLAEQLVKLSLALRKYMARPEDKT